jgi:hypothetical protein
MVGTGYKVGLEAANDVEVAEEVMSWLLVAGQHGRL